MFEEAVLERQYKMKSTKPFKGKTNKGTLKIFQTLELPLSGFLVFVYSMCGICQWWQPSKLEIWNQVRP